MQQFDMEGIRVFCFVYVVKEFHEFKDDCNILELIIV